MDGSTFDYTWFWAVVGIVAVVAGVLWLALMATLKRDRKGPGFEDIRDEMAGRKRKR